MTFSPLDIVGVMTAQVGSSLRSVRNDGAYSVPVRLSRAVDRDEALLFVELWNAAPVGASHHRREIRIVADALSILETTIEEVAAIHATTLRSVVDAFNREMPVRHAQRAEEAARVARAEAEHRRHVEEVAAGIRFR